jgi:hypothetical protein
MWILALFLELTNGAIQDLFDFSPSFYPAGKPEAPSLRAIKGSQ